MNKEIKVIKPPNVVWIEYKLNNQEMDYVWRCIENRKEFIKDTLVGHISSSYKLMDRGDWFWTNTIDPLVARYNESFDTNLGSKVPTNNSHPYHMSSWWVNYQKKNEFNPIHDHNGVYSFVIWMKIPTDWKKQNINPLAATANTSCISSFQFSYHDITGKCQPYYYQLSPQDEGTMILFPSVLQHQVYPFYECDEERISVSGNVLLNTDVKS